MSPNSGKRSSATTRPLSTATWPPPVSTVWFTAVAISSRFAPMHTMFSSFGARLVAIRHAAGQSRR